MSTFKILSQVLAEKNYFDVSEIESIIAVYFKIWLSDLKNDSLQSTDFAKRRNKAISEYEQLSIRRSAIEKQIFDAKQDIREGKAVDTRWLNRANFAFRMIKSEIVSKQAEISNINSVEKQQNIQSANTRERMIKGEVLNILKERFGDEYAIELFQQAQKISDKKILING